MRGVARAAFCSAALRLARPKCISTACLCGDAGPSGTLLFVRLKLASMTRSAGRPPPAVSERRHCLRLSARAAHRQQHHAIYDFHSLHKRIHGGVETCCFTKDCPLEFFNY